MSGLTGAMNVALTGVDAFQTGIQTVGNNISNQATPGYAIRTLDPVTSVFGSGQAGSGVVNPVAVRRAADSFAASRLNAATSANGAAQTLSAALSAIDQSLQGNGDIQSATNQFFAGLATLASNPTNSAQAQVTIANGGNVVSAFHAAAQGLSEQAATITGILQQNIVSANQILNGLAGINKQLQEGTNSNSLLDKQEADLTALSKMIGISTVPLSSGAVEVTAGGVVLLDQSGAQQLALGQSGASAAPNLITVGAGKVPLSLPGTSGSLGGSLVAFANTQNTTQSLNWFAGAVAGLVNTAQAEGLTANGTQGTTLFGVPAPSVTAAATNAGSGTLVATVTNSSNLPSNGRGYVLTYGSGGWTATVPGTSQSYTLAAGPTLTLPGLMLAVSGAPVVGDSFTVNPEPGAAQSLSLATTDPTAIATADPYVVTAGSVSSSGTVTNTNAGTESELSATVTSSPPTGAAVVPASYFGQSLTLKFTSPTAYQISSGSGTTVASGTWGNGGVVAIAYPSGSLAAGQYWQANLIGAPAAGDTMTLTPGGLNSGSNAQRMAGLWTAPSTLPGGSLQGAILSIVGTAGSNSQAAQTVATGAAQTVTAAQNNLAAIAGVDPNQQAVELTQYQQAFQAAAMVISTAHAMFESLITAIG